MFDVDYKSAVFANLEKATKARRQIMADPDLSDEGRRKALAARVDPLIADAVTLAQAWKGQGERRLAKAETDYRKQLTALETSGDPAWRRYHRERWAGIMSAGDWEAVAQRIETAIDASDVIALRELADAWPLVAQRFPASAGGPSSDLASGVGAYRNKVNAAVASFVPPELKQAEDEFKAASVELQELRGKLGSENLRAQLQGQPEPFAAVLTPPAQTVEVGGPDDPNGWYFTSAGGGSSIFG